MRVLSEPNKCPDNFNVAHLANESMPLCYDEYANEKYVGRIIEAFKNVFDYDNDGVIDLKQTSVFFLSEKIGLILISPKNEKFLDQDVYFQHGKREELNSLFPTYEILIDSELYGHHDLALLENLLGFYINL